MDLRNCREAMDQKGRVPAVEHAGGEAPESFHTRLSDLEMLVMTSGERERNEAEFAALPEKAGPRLNRVLPFSRRYA